MVKQSDRFPNIVEKFSVALLGQFVPFFLLAGLLRYKRKWESRKLLHKAN